MGSEINRSDQNKIFQKVIDGLNPKQKEAVDQIKDR